MENISRNYIRFEKTAGCFLGAEAGSTDMMQHFLIALNGLLIYETCLKEKKAAGNPAKFILEAFRDYAKRQGIKCCDCYDDFERTNAWLTNQPQFMQKHENTDLTALNASCFPNPGNPYRKYNTSAGYVCLASGIATGLWASEFFEDPEAVCRLCADAASATHGHETGFLSGALAGCIIYLITKKDKQNITVLIKESLSILENAFSDLEGFEKVRKKVTKAVSLAERNAAIVPDSDAVSVLSESNISFSEISAPDALAILCIALFYFVRYDGSFENTLSEANDGGISGTFEGFVAGCFCGAYTGYEEISEQIRRKFRPSAAATEILTDLIKGCPGKKTSEYKKWTAKYVSGEYFVIEK
ncbi:MAG: ADP-ribosylglycohydrolase family protein [Clostridia bacterium]|nr:ADP-ribosylglycohydrolase family protein [Clostridia bacterium]